MPRSNLIYRYGIVPIEASEGKLWRDAWNESQNLIEVPGQRTVAVYGHDARAGLQVRREMESSEDLGEEGVNGVWSRYTFGLDSGCVYGNELSVLVVEASSDMRDMVHGIEQVKKT